MPCHSTLSVSETVLGKALEEANQDMSAPNQPHPDSFNAGNSAFPILGDDLKELPAIPGGWKSVEYPIGQRSISIYCPADPDQFIDNDEVLAESDKNDYMPFWTIIWPAAVHMAEAIEHAPWRIGSHVLELGSGLGLVGLAAMQRGDQVTFSDYDPTALHMCRMNAIKNELPDPEVLLLDWRSPVAGLFDVIIGCEVTYDAPMHSVILNLCDKMLKQDGVCWLGDPGRYLSPDFYRLALSRNYSVKILNKELQEIEIPSSEGFQIFELRKR